ncbi:zinc finger protein [Brazilian marseillevirus]|uniref:zinc finger protein n=1 Tax=Brazilian marseillevirus TaxID=1813599 RepID=UPI000781432D|nr:zinc finger protein [Brazilian marseillevirus]AMQ10611.1 zinc finger protein [Brazilian marseillevirus]
MELRCDVCETTFSTKASLTRHTKSKRHLKTLSPAQEKIYECKACLYSTKIKCNYKAHVKSKKHISRCVVYKDE